MNEIQIHHEDAFVFHKIVWNVLSVVGLQIVFLGGFEGVSVQGMVVVNDAVSVWNKGFSLAGVYVLNVLMGLIALYLVAVVLVSVLRKRE